MDFIDEATVYVKAGKGGNGLLSFRREKFIEFGGPNGGDGGRGGNVIFISTDSSTTLLNFMFHPHITADNGKCGGSYNRTGESGKDLLVYVPLGTTELNRRQVINMQKLGMLDG